MTDADIDLMGEDDDAVERDPETGDMFAAAVAPPPSADASTPYKVLARKYRPQRFEDLIGQEAMVRTLTNAFASGRIAHAFMLTGVRGVGKTTTARLLARALNYETDGVRQPSVALSVEGRHCQAIIEGRHMDVLELDAASRTKVDEDAGEAGIDAARAGKGGAQFRIKQGHDGGNDSAYDEGQGGAAAGQMQHAGAGDVDRADGRQGGEGEQQDARGVEGTVEGGGGAGEGFGENRGGPCGGGDGGADARGRPEGRAGGMCHPPRPKSRL